MEPIPPEPPVRPGILLAHGARATEAALLAHLDRLLDAPDALARLARPVRVVVPSVSLRLHLGAVLVRRRGAVAGITLQTLFSTAWEVLERCGRAPPWHRLPGDLPYEVLVRRLARREAELSRGLDFLTEGYGAVSATVRDLLDAGLEPVLADAAEEALEDARTRHGAPPITAEEVSRGRALVRVAARVDEEMERYGVLRRNALLARATDLLARRPEEALPARAVLIHGFADATGLATDFLEALLRHRGARLFADAPPDPADLSGARCEDTFGERFRERLSGVGGMQEAAAPGATAPADGGVELELFAAPGGEAEAREVAVRVRRLLDAGAAAEGIGVVARETEPHAAALRRHFATLGVPWSGVRARGSLTTAGRRTHALLHLLQHRGELPTERWLDAAAALPAGAHGHGGGLRGPFVDLRLAFAASGCGRLRDAAALDLDRLLDGRDALPLPVRTGLAYRDAAAVEDETKGAADGATQAEARGAPAARPTAYARRRTVPRHRLAAAVAAARATLDHVESWPGDGAGEAPPEVHLEHLHDLLTGRLGWSAAAADADAEPGRPVFDALENLARDLPSSLPLTFDELRLVLSRALEDAGRTPLGGRGGGVQTLSVMEARGRTFEHLFLLGVHRGAFPRTVRQDPLLPDELRDELAFTVLPDVPRKRSGFAEERHLFAQLLSAAPRVTVSWQLHDDDGRPLAPSPLLERLGIERPETVAPAGTGLPPAEPARAAIAPPVYSAAAGGDGSARAAWEEAALAGLRGAPRSHVGRLLALAFEEARPPGLGASPLSLPAGALAAARLAVLEEMDPDAGHRRHLGPYFGFLGAVSPRRRRDPRHDDPWLTHVENLAACPWQLFLRRLLRVEPTPDPLQALPGADPLLLGNVVHGVLERLVEEAGGHTRAPLAATLAAEPAAVPWPGDEHLDRLLRDTARRVLADEGLHLPGLARALALRARPYVEAAGRLDWAAGDPLPVLGAEVEGEITLPDAAGRPRTLRFRADRVDGPAEGPVRLTDYKTGKPIYPARPGTRDETLRHHHLTQLRSGTRLQATAYHRAAAAQRPGGAVGRYLFLKPELERAEFAVGGDPPWDRRATAALAAATATALAAWDTGAFFPRLEDPKTGHEPQRCSWCEVAQACLRGDSGARRRLAEWNAEHAGTARSEAELAHHEVWRLATGEEIEGEIDREEIEIEAEGDAEEAGVPDPALRDAGLRPAPRGCGEGSEPEEGGEGGR